MEQSIIELTTLLQIWEDGMQTLSYNPIPTLSKLCELFEAESKKYLKKDTDLYGSLFHPSQIDPTCVLVQMYTIMLRQNSFMKKLVIDYLKEHHWPTQTKDNHNLNVAACRLVMNLIPGLETTFILESLANDQLFKRLFTWAENAKEPLQTYATRLLAYFRNLTYNAPNFNDHIIKLIPIILDRLHSYYTQFCEKNEINQSIQPYQNSDQLNDDIGAPSSRTKRREDNGICIDINSSFPESNARNWIQIYPPTLTTKLVYCLKYLVFTRQYQEFLSHAYEKNALNLVMKIINSSEKQNDYLTLEALKYLAALICQKQFAIEFIDLQGLQKLLLIPIPSIPSTGVSICFYYLSYCEEIMERICLLPKHVLVDLVKYAICMLECSNESSRCHATMFFKYSLPFRVIQEIFDNYDGLRKLFNVASTLISIVSSEDPAYSSSTEDNECKAKQIIRHVCAGLKNYFEAHLHIKAQQIHRAKMRDSDLLISSTMLHLFFTVPSYKSTKKSRAEVQEEIELLLNAVSLNWEPVDQLLKLGGLDLLFSIINLANKWRFSEGNECKIIENALEVLNICAVLPKFQLALCGMKSQVAADNQNHSSTVGENDQRAKNDNVGLNIIMKEAEGNMLDADIKKAALSVIITCVCAPIRRELGSIAHYSSHGLTKKRTPKTYDDDDAVIETIWDCIRNNHGIMVLITLMTIKTPITDVDAIRGLASRALGGLARSESVCQILRKLPLFNSGELQNLMKNPVLQEKHHEHLTFQKYALELMELVLEKKISNGAEIKTSLANINQARVVTQTKIDEQQLNLLIYQYLMEKNLPTTAELLLKEANSHIAKKNSTPFAYISHCRNRSIGGGISPISPKQVIQNQKFELVDSSHSPLDAVFSARGMNQTPTHLNVIRRSENCPESEIEQELESPVFNSIYNKIDQDLTLPTDNNTNPKVSLESIVTEHLRNQHATCKHPMVICPEFNLFVPHKCPDPKPRSSMCTNFAMRFSKNIHSRKLNQRLIHSRFCPTINVHKNYEEGCFSCCEFISQNCVVIGTYNGVIKLFNLFTPQKELSFEAHNKVCIADLECSNDERLLLSSAPMECLTSIWSITEYAIDIKYSYHEKYCTFSNYDQNKILGTKDEIATIYDLETSKRILKLVPRHSNHYYRNQAAFDATNKLVLSDGVLWDAIAGKEIHKFAKLNQCMSGIFHPNGLEIISNKEVWDIRTLQLLRTVSSLDKCNVRFSKSGEGMYLYVFDSEIDKGSKYQTLFKTLDPNDYSNIATVDVKHRIYHMACNSYDTQIAIVESEGMIDTFEGGSIVQVYDVGRSKNSDEDVQKVDSEDSVSEDENTYSYPLYLEEMIAGSKSSFKCVGSNTFTSDSEDEDL